MPKTGQNRNEPPESLTYLKVNGGRAGYNPELYAKHLTAEERRSLAAASDGASGRDLRDVCEAAERRLGGER